MRIAMLSYHTDPLAPLGGKHTGGMNVYVRELSRQLAGEGQQVDVFTRSTGDGERIEELQDGLRIIRLPAGPEGEVEKNQLSSHIPAFVQAMIDFVDDAGYDLIHAHYWMSGLVGARLKTAWGVPMLLMFHTLGLVKNRIEALGPLESETRILGERSAAIAADKVIAATPIEHAQLQWLYEVPAEKIEVVPPGVNLKLFQPVPKAEARRQLSLPPEKPIVLYVGRVEPLKGIGILVRAVKQLKGMQGLQVLVVGGEADLSPADQDSEMGRLRQLVSELDLSEQVDFLGSREQEELPLYYSAADVVVVPSYYESFGMVALEAMACGTPVVASRVGGLAFLVQDGVTGFHVPEGDVDALATRLDELLKGDGLIDSVGANAVVFAKSLSWGQTAEHIQDVYSSLT